MRRIFAIIALLLAVIAPAAALDFPLLDGRVIDEAHLLDEARRNTLENKLADLEARTSKQLLVVTLASARGMTVDDYGLALRKHWSLEPNGKRVMLIVGPRDGRSVIQFDRALKETLPDTVTDSILNAVMVPKFNTGDFPGGVVLAADSIIDALGGAPRPAAQRLAQNDITVPATPEFPALSGRVVDDAGVLDSATREALRAKLAAHEARTTDQIVVATVRSLHGNSVEDYANRLFRRWQLGQKGKNNGVLLLHAPSERKIRIEVGYGLEGTLTDAITKYIITNAIAPRFKANDFSGGMTRGVDDIIKVLSGDAEEFKQRATPRSSWNFSTDSAAPMLLFFIPIALFIIVNAFVGLLRLLHEFLVSLGLAKRKPREGFWHSVDNWSYAGSSGSSSSSSSWGSSSSSSSGDSFSGGGGDSGGGGSSGDY